MATDTDDETVYSANWAAFPLLFARRYIRKMYAQFVALRTRSKVFVLALLVIYTGLFIAFFAVGPKKVMHGIHDAAQGLRDIPGGWAVLGAIMIVTSVPPFFGFTTTTTLCGFVYGLKGFAIAGPATYLGSAFAFIILRMMFSHHIRGWSNDNANWRALGSVMRAKGLPLMCLIRLCPLPWTGSNMLFASIEAVSFAQFMIATTAVQMKIFIAVFVGARLANLADGEESDSTSKWINSISIVVAIAIASLTGIYVWRVTRAEIEKLEDIPAEERRLAEHAVEDLEEAPIIEPYTD